MASDTGTDQDDVRRAASLGWAMTEFLSRCYSLGGHPPPKQPDFLGHVAYRCPFPLPATGQRSDRQTVRAMIFHIAYLADKLDVTSHIPNNLKLADGKSDPCVGEAYTDVLAADTMTLTELEPSDTDSWNKCLADINARLYYWDMKIQDGLQRNVAATYNAYLVARNLAAMRWTLAQKAVAALPAQTWLEKDPKGFEAAIYLLGGYLPAYAPGALVNSVSAWKSTLVSPSEAKSPPTLDGDTRRALEEQAEIWEALITGRRDPLSYVDLKETTHTSAVYFWRVLRSSWPLFAVALAIVVAILIVVLIVVNAYTHAGPSVYVGATIAGVFAFLTLAGTSLATVNSAWQKGVGELAGTVGHALTDQLWATAQQDAVNKATLTPIPSKKRTSQPSPDAEASQRGLE
ncbi:MAG TPA: hypothetical protein VJN88_10345 [Ktedonobacterales bacterium]|nr:hypothetical protein [Ktedonobacterales bacterium]